MTLILILIKLNLKILTYNNDRCSKLSIIRIEIVIIYILKPTITNDHLTTKSLSLQAQT